MLRIEDYALIGDCQTAALVGRDGSIDWLCWPRFDSPACFAGILGGRKHGHWGLRPKGEYRVRRRYRPDTLILETTFETAQGEIALIDFMPAGEWDSDVVRIACGRRGRVAMTMELVLRFDYGSYVPWVSRLEDGRLRAIAGPDMVILDGPVKTHGENLTTVAEFELGEGERLPFVLMHSPSHLEPPRTIDAEKALEETEAFWTHWTGQCRAKGAWEAVVRRSLITLKALTYAPTGGIVAAPTTSLPEKLGGMRNWDYRFCWLRDATLTLLAFMDAGYFEEAEAWREWLVRAVAGSPEQMQIMYGLSGERRLLETELGWLPGYEASAPVRVGNAAWSQLQLDVYGEVMDALHQARKGGLARNEASWGVQQALLRHLENVWDRPDEGIWEMRGPPRHFTFSKVMCWVAFDRGIKAIENYQHDGPVERWRALRARIHDEVCRRGYDAEKNAFVQSYGSKALDASLLLLPITGFVEATDPRMLGTVRAIEAELLEGGFVHRYRTDEADDGLPPGEGAFLACSFWLADNYVLQGRTREARELFERLVGLANDVGLLAEEYDPAERRQLGNFPQAFSHIALVNTAFNLGEALKPAEERSK
ncbi:MAG TPA: glycoside hydrolase family 15 protein [Burkholderiales bacterium]|nr:glycoside hydrolase family 15 protein [Burkholderiales bacterium]